MVNALAETPLGRALRALQRLDELVSTGNYRHHLIEAQDVLAGELGLDCTGEDQGGGIYDHSGVTCPVHEWLVREDQFGLVREVH